MNSQTSQNNHDTLWPSKTAQNDYIAKKCGVNFEMCNTWLSLNLHYSCHVTRRIESCAEIPASSLSFPSYHHRAIKRNSHFASWWICLCLLVCLSLWLKALTSCVTGTELGSGATWASASTATTVRSLYMAESTSRRRKTLTASPATTVCSPTPATSAKSWLDTIQEWVTLIKGTGLLILGVFVFVVLVSLVWTTGIIDLVLVHLAFTLSS